MRSHTFTRRSLGASAFFTLPLLCTGGLLAAGLLPGCSTSAPTGDATLYFSAIPDANKTELDEGYGKVAAYLAKELGVPVKFRPAIDYSASVEAFKNGDIQLAWFGGVTGVQARRAVPGARAIAQGKVDPEYVSYFVANVATGIQPSASFPMALAGKRFTFGPETSTSGRVMPEFYIREATGKSPADFFGHANKHTKGHDITAKEVEAGTVDAGVLSYAKYDDMVAKGDLDPAKCVKIWTTPPYPDYNWTAHPSLETVYGAGFTEKLQKALVGIKDPELLGVLLRKDGLIPAENKDFDRTATTMAAIGM
ncbi:MAG: putative selenate ABC transporter substrate-binding protein [Planctomycetota bacterium]